MEVWIDAWIDVWIDGWTDGRTPQCIDAWMRGCTSHVRAREATRRASASRSSWPLRKRSRSAAFSDATRRAAWWDSKVCLLDAEREGFRDRVVKSGRHHRGGPGGRGRAQSADRGSLYACSFCSIHVMIVCCYMFICYLLPSIAVLHLSMRVAAYVFCRSRSPPSPRLTRQAGHVRFCQGRWQYPSRHTNLTSKLFPSSGTLGKNLVRIAIRESLLSSASPSGGVSNHSCARELLKQLDNISHPLVTNTYI